MSEKNVPQLIEVQAERYLAALDRSLQGLPVSRKSEIVLETRAVLSRIALDSSGVDDFLARVRSELGTPPARANRYRGPAGLPPVAEKADFRWLRWALGGLVLFVVVAGFAVFFLLRSFLPVFEQDSESGKFRFLGGWMEIDPVNGEVSLGKGRYQVHPDQMQMSVAVSDGGRIKGVTDLGDATHVEVRGGKGMVTVRVSGHGKPKRLSYDCRTQDGSAPPSAGGLVSRGGGDRVRVSLPTGTNANLICDLTIPPGPELDVDLENGNITLLELEQSVRATLGNGNIAFKPKDVDRFEINARVDNGTINLPDQAPAIRDLRAELKVARGTITGP